jgi:hypothetical protein
MGDTIGLMNVWPILVLMGSVTQFGPGVPALTEAQVAQLATAQDRSRQWDAAALYPLLSNVVDWPRGDEGGAMVPAYAQLHAEPARFRGQLVLIEGQLGAAPSRITEPLSRPGPWDRNIQQWHVLVRRDPDEAVVLLLADPMPPEQLPGQGGAAVRAIVRFYKVWSYVDQNNQPTDYLLFVGRWITVDAPGIAGSSVGRPGGTPGGSGRWMWGVLVVVFMWYLFWRFRRLMLRNRPVTGMARTIPRQEVAEQCPPDAPLGDDPAAALHELHRRRAKDRPSPDV